MDVVLQPTAAGNADYKSLPAMHKLHYDEFHTFFLPYIGRKSITWYSLNLWHVFII